MKFMASYSQGTLKKFCSSTDSAMEELSLYILDIVQNSVSAGSSQIIISLLCDEQYMTLKVIDDGCGMDENMIEEVLDPFKTSRTTRKVGLGIPLLKESCEITGGSFSMTSKVAQGTKTYAKYKMSSFNRPPIGNLGQTMAVLMCCNPKVNFVLECQSSKGRYDISTVEIVGVLGDVPISNPNVGDFIERDVNDGISSVFEEDII